MQFLDVFHPDLLTGDFRRLLRFNADGTPVNLAGTNLNVGTVFRPGTITRNAANAITGGVPYPNNMVPQSEWNRNAPGFLNVLRQIYGQVDMSQAQPVPGNSPEFIRVPSDVLYDFKKDQEVVRVDYQMSANTNMFFRAVTRRPARRQPARHLLDADIPRHPHVPGEARAELLVQPVQRRLAEDHERDHRRPHEPGSGRGQGGRSVDRSATIAISSASGSATSIRRASTAGR